MPEPWVLRSVNTLLAEFLATINRHDLILEFGLSAFEINILNVERTMAEKILSLIKSSRSDKNSKKLKSKIRHIYDLCMIIRQDNYLKFMNSEKMLEMLRIVEQTDREKFPDAEKWLTHPLHETDLFAHPQQIWSTLSSEFHQSFAALVYDNDLPSNNEVYSMLTAVHSQLLRL